MMEQIICMGLEMGYKHLFKFLYVHCSAHNLNLCLQDASKMQDFMKYV